MTRKGQTQIPAGERRKSILDAAFDLFTSQGYNGTSIRDIARKAGTSLSNLYYYYQDKEALFTAVFTENHPYLQILAILNDAPDDQDAPSIMREVGEKMATYIEEHPVFMNLVFIEIIEFQGRHLLTMAQSVIPSVEIFIKRFDNAPGREVLRPISPDLILRAFVGMFVAYAISKRILSNFSPEASTNNVESYVDIFLHGILQSDSPQP
jgi:AcrR family transcriptional regulator